MNLGFLVWHLGLEFLYPSWSYACAEWYVCLGLLRSFMRMMTESPSDTAAWQHCSLFGWSWACLNDVEVLFFKTIVLGIVTKIAWTLRLCLYWICVILCKDQSEKCMEMRGIFIKKRGGDFVQWGSTGDELLDRDQFSHSDTARKKQKAHLKECSQKNHIRKVKH